jgi:hypothetical protein
MADGPTGASPSLLAEPLLSLTVQREPLGTWVTLDNLVPGDPAPRGPLFAGRCPCPSRHVGFAASGATSICREQREVSDPALG